MKKAFLFLLITLLVLCSVGCRGSVPETKPTEPATAAPAENPTQVPPAETAAPEEPEAVFYFSNFLETNRVYRQGLDGSGLTRICDVEATQVKEMGDTLYFIDRDGHLCRCPADGGSAETVYAEYPLVRLYKGTETALAFVCEQRDEDGYVTQHLLLRYDLITGKTEQIAGNLLSDSLGGDHVVLYTLPQPETYETEYYGYDFLTGESRKYPGLDMRPLWCDGEAVYGRRVTDEKEEWFRYDLASLTQEKIDLNASGLDQVLGYDGTGFLMNRESEIYKVEGKERTLLQRFEGQWILIEPVAQKGDTVILSVAEDRQEPVFDESWNYLKMDYYAVSLSGDTVTKITASGEAGNRFAEGEFPQMDVSTARKPLAGDITNLFFRQYGKKGTEPMNHKSHGAWLNLADKGCDLILAPAPTEEEKAYLREKGVQIEGKVFGADGLVFISGTGSGVDNLSMDELRAIYRGEIKNWKELGGVDHPITVYYRNDQSGSQRQFEKLVWDGEELPDFAGLGFEIMDDMSSIVWECQRNPYAIGYSIMTYLSDVFGNRNVRLMGIDGVVPTLETVTDNSYSLTLQDYVVIRADEPADSPARRLYDWFGTPHCDDILLRNGLTPIHTGKTISV